MRLLISTFCCFVMTSAMAGCGYKGSIKESHLLIDSFTYHYKRLDSMINANPYDTSKACIYSVQYMEKVTGIKSHPDGNFIGWMAFTKRDLIAWKEWYDKSN